jgi:beta-lactamase class A
MRTITVALLVAIAAGALGVGALPASASSASLASRIEALAGEFAGGAAIWVSDPRSAPVYTREADREVLAASLYKLAILAAVEQQVELGRLDYGDTIVIDGEDVTADGSWLWPGTEVTIDEALELMITVSDNGTAVHLWRMLGAEGVNALLRKSGMPDFHIAADWNDDHVVTARSVATFYTLLAKRQLVSPAASDRMLERLARQQINDRIPAELPGGTKVAHKTGNLVGVVHDAGIVFTPRGPEVVVALTWDADEASADQFIANVASAVYAEAATPPEFARYRLPDATRYAVTGDAVTFEVRVENVSEQAWTVTGASRIGLAWELRDPLGALVARSARPLPLGNVPRGRSVKKTVIVDMPEFAADLALVLGLVDATGRPLAKLGVATASLAVVVRPPVVTHGWSVPAFAP